MLRSGQRLAHKRLTHRPATAAADTARPGPPAVRSCGSPRPSSGGRGRALVTPPRTAVVSSHVGELSQRSAEKLKNRCLWPVAAS